MRRPDFLTELSAALLPLEHPAPGAGSARRAAVLVLLYPRAGQVHVVLTLRPNTLARHPGQISLPGGMVEAGDGTLWNTAVREAREELGLLPGRVVPLGRLLDVGSRTGESTITPFVGWNPVSPRFKPDRSEVAEILEVPLHTLLDPGALEEEVWELRGSPWRVAFYRLGRQAVWGITGSILSDLHDRLQAGSRTLRAGTVQPVTHLSE